MINKIAYAGAAPPSQYNTHINYVLNNKHFFILLPVCMLFLCIKVKIVGTHIIQLRGFRLFEIETNFIFKLKKKRQRSQTKNVTKFNFVVFGINNQNFQHTVIMAIN